MPLSQASRGCKVSTHKTFVRNERAIHKALNNCIADRTFGVCVRDLCRTAGVSSPTFYAHSANITQAYHKYEESLIEEFVASTYGRPLRSVIFVLLLSFVYRHRDYFRATLGNSDFFVIGRVLDRIRILLVGMQISDQSYLYYRNKIASMIMLWAKFDHFKKARLEYYLEKIERIRVEKI